MMHRHRTVLPLVAVLAGIAMLAVPPPARADFKLRLQESGYSDQVITWSGDLDAFGNRQITWSGKYGDFNLTFTLTTSNSQGARISARSPASR